MGSMLTRLGLKPGEAIVHPWINKALEKAQKKVEARNFDTRKNVLKYDNVMNDQRREVYAQRREFMKAADVSETVADMRRLHALSTELAAARDDLSGPMNSLLQVILEFHGATHGFLTLHRDAENTFAVVAQRGLAVEHPQVVGACAEDTATRRESVLAAHARFAVQRMASSPV